ncbi:hypothetical protein KR222_008007 [Zaprionus bogoriensis]|nr:hypothetical protein KR222_008007 [Zaprionus bogoriensis]
MSWFNLWDGLKTKTCRYLLQRYLGQFFENNLNLEQLKVDLYNGKAVVEDISLKVNALNELFEEQGWAFEVISGHIGCLTVMVPWNALMTNDSSLSISDMTITLRPVTRCQSGTTMLESMWSSVSSSMQMAEECMKQVDDDIPFLNHNNTLIGLEKFAETIDNVLNRIHASLKNTTINIEYTLPKSLRKLIISIKADHVEYKNQTGSEKPFTTHEGSSSEGGEQHSTLNSLPMIAKHNLVTNGLTVYTAEIIGKDSYSMELEYIQQLCKIVEFKGCQNFQICVKQTENIVGPKINLEMIIDEIYFMLTPRQIQLLFRISKGFNSTRPQHKLLKQYTDIRSEVNNTLNPSKMTGIIERDGEWCSEDSCLQKSEYLYSDIKQQNCESVASLTSTNSMTTSYSTVQRNLGSVEKSGEILKFRIQIFKIVGTFLQNDVLFENKTKNLDFDCIFCNESFLSYSETADAFFPSTCVEDNLSNSSTRIKNKNYLSFMVSCLLVNGNQQRFCNELTLKTSLSATTVDLSEILENVEYPLITFDRKKNCHDGYHTRPEVSLSHTSTQFYKQNSNRSSNKIECTLDDCTADFDISIYDRLSVLFGVSAFEECDSLEIAPIPTTPMEIQIKCSLIKLHLRFPIVDGRSSLDPKKISCWKKNIRNDYLTFNFQNILVLWKSCINVIVDEIDGFYCDKHFIPIMKCSSRKKSDQLSTEQQNLKRNRKSPFSSNCVYGYSSNVEGLNDNADKNDIFLPGETEEINEFCQSSKSVSDIQVSASIPNVKIVLECKELYEIIYNRIIGDLLMWEPRSTLFQDDEMKNQVKYNMGRDERGSGSNHHTTFPELITPKNCDNSLFNMFSFDLCFEEGILTLYTDIQDLEKGCQQSNRGILQLDLKEFRLFSVSGFNYDKNVNYFCLQLNQMDVFHSGEMLVNLNDAWNDTVSPNLIRIINSFPLEQRKLNKRHEMISVVAQLKKNTHKRLKRIKLAFGINGAIFLHKPTYPAYNWIYQLIDFFNITEYPIEAYEPYDLVSEVQGHMWNSAIQYRPKSLPYRTIVDIGTCSLSSNITYPMTGCTLKLRTEDCIISIGPTVNINYVGLVPVLNIGLLNISIRRDENNKQFPSIDLRSSIHEVHLKTCYDSADALAQLIAYIANDKDLTPIEKNTFDKTIPPLLKSDQNSVETSEHIHKLMADAVKDLETTKTQISPNKTSELKQSASGSQSTSYSKALEESNMYDYESNIMLQSYYHQNSENTLPQIQADLEATSKADASLVEKDYDVIQDNEISLLDNFGVEQIYVSEDPLQIVDNHFCLPNEKTDLLRPPGSFPISDQSYTLCEMTFTWHLFGGNDFPDKIDPCVSKGNTSRVGMSETYKHGVSQVPKDTHRTIKNAAYDGPNISQRNLNVLVEIRFSKIRFSYDIYPAQSMYSSRQVLLISDIEIRDRLAISEINKLLYHPFKDSKPHKTDEHMVNVKALNVRSNLKNRSEECSLKVSVLPIRLNIDQDTLLFLEEFFTALIERSTDASRNKDVETSVPNRDDPILHDLHLTPIIDRNCDDPIVENMENLNEFEDSTFNAPVYFKEFIFSPPLPICFDYHGRRVELSRGPITGLLMGLAQLQGSEIRLREVVNRRGILGWSKLFDFLCKEWLKDIKRNQLPNILSGIGPTNAVLQLFQGFFDLFRLPLQQYNKDGRIMRGFQLGAQSFSARTAYAALEITSRIIHLLQFTAETTFDILSVGPSVNRRRKSKPGKKRQDRPKDIREGVANAYIIVKEGINETASTLVEAAVVEHDQKGYSGAVGAVVRQLPQLVVCPAVLATQATTNILGGAKSSLVPEAKREARDKWKHASN